MIDKLQLEQVTRDLGWIRKLAHALVQSDAEDLAHDAWLVASNEMPTDRPPRRWLARVTTNLARMRGRSATRRRAREVSSIEPEPAPSPAELVERVQLQRLVAGEVLALDEPYRSTLLLHYFEGMSSAEIARRHGISDGTVRWRLKGALDEIRDRLRAREDAPKGGWLAMLAPLARPIGHEAQPPVGIASGGAALLGIGAVATLVAVVLILGALRSHSDEPEAPAIAAAPPIARVFPASTDPKPASESSRDPGVFAQPEAPSHHVAGKVTSHGAAVAGATVRIGVVVAVHRPRSTIGDGATAELVAETSTGRDGTFDFGELPPASYTIVAATPSLASSAVSVALADPTLHADRLVVELGNCELRISGAVRDANQRPIARAHVVVQGLSSVETAGDGQYSVCLPADAPVRVSAEGFASLEATPAGRGDTARDFELVPETIVVGTVVDQQDHPIAGARIVATPTSWQRHADMYAAQLWSIADDDGRFAITGMAAGEYELVAVHPGVVDSEWRIVTTRAKRPTEARLVVRTGARIRGHLVHTSRPVGGVRVLAKSWGTMDTTAVSQTDGTFVIDGAPFGDTIVAAGGASTKLVVDHREMQVDLDVGSVPEIAGYIRRDGRPLAGARVTCMPAVVFDDGIASTVSDAEGRYKCAGATGTHVFASADCEHGRPRSGFATGTSTDIDVQPCSFAPRSLHVRGDVRARSGSPLVGAEVWFTDGEHVITDADGRFEIFISPEAAPRVYPRNHMWGYLLVGNGSEGVRTGPPVVDEQPLHLVVTGDPASAVGHVADRDGHAVAGARVTVRCGAPLDRWDRDATHTALTRADGWFSVTNVVAMPQGCSVDIFTGTDNVTLPWTGAFLDVVVGVPRTAYVRLRDWTQRPPMVTARSVATGDVVVAEVDGATAELRDIVPGWYEIAADDGDYRSVETARLGDASTPVLTRWTLGGDPPGERTFHIIDVDTGRPVAGMACESTLGAGNVAVSDAGGNVTMPKEADPNCWSTRGPWVPAWDAHEGVIVTVLERPGTTNAGFIVGPESARLVVAVVDADGAASTAGLRTGDRIVELDGAAVSQLSPRELMYLVWTHTSGTMRVGVDRAGTHVTVAIAIR